MAFTRRTQPRPWLIMLMPYFGSWPEWINLFMASCGANETIRWRFITDCGRPENCPSNVEFHDITFEAFKRMVSERLGFLFDHADPYRICEMRPALGFLYEDQIREFEFFGYGDIDVILGDIDRFYAPIRSQYDMISTHPTFVAGHFAVFRNTCRMRRAFFEVAGYPELLQHPYYSSFEEFHFAKLFHEQPRWKAALRLAPRALFKDQYVTVLSPRGWHDGTQNYPLRWYWRNGRLTNDRDGSREFPYLHFMRWKSLRYAPAIPAETEGAWASLERLVWVDWCDAIRNGFCISPQGFRPLSPLGVG